MNFSILFHRVFSGALDPAASPFLIQPFATEMLPFTFRILVIYFLLTIYRS